MRRTILYYPSIVIPDGTWLKKSLLYWDEVSSIVPREIEYEAWNNNYLLEFLSYEDQYRPIFPDELMNHEIFTEFENEMIRKYKYFQKQKNNEHGRKSKRGIFNISEEDSYSIHRDKLTYRLSNILGLDRFVKNNEGDWLLLERTFAEIYMATLAKYIALADVNYTVIGTDKASTVNRIYSDIRKSQEPVFSKIEPVINLSINILPVPSPDTSYKDIIKFKRKYRDELLAFRTILNNYEQQISNVESEHQLKEYTILFKEQMEKGTRETIKMLRGSGINYLLSSLRSIINIKSPTMLSTFAGIAGYKMDTFSPSTVGMLVGVATTVDVAVNYMSIKRSALEKLSDKGFLYLYRARSKGIVQDFI
ncbi:DUF6236 family protein [Brevibacillus sp. Leaf182]|uniref:DUF6236 family protein n=1 Tax=Brevibacillus sp. Leaf182 TaxID=1736290 RepID=UPI0006F5BB4F|nr:DUF6236 family protein [Brevibacillus sp. Leaf182]RAT98421.1 hypothetical protein ASG16_006925 [Brevibacillus sp. Leaf182]